jgi:hypothetical protein
VSIVFRSFFFFVEFKASFPLDRAGYFPTSLLFPLLTDHVPFDVSALFFRISRPSTVAVLLNTDLGRSVASSATRLFGPYVSRVRRAVGRLQNLLP